ncbi:hypothetical protein EZS27_023368 [termite gut metagenome]|uniref:BT4734-like N-terminal domain-containing protein n=1 Tax=termite gut metagenome TaxID=433724 RepID=A0A5J4R4Z9_9ZZZZ
MSVKQEEKSYCYSPQELKKLCEDRKNDPHKFGIKVGLKEFDTICRFKRKKLCVWTGRANGSKSSFLFYYSYLLNKSNGIKTLFINYEDPAEEIFEKIQYMGNDTFDYIFDDFYFAKTSLVNDIDSIMDCIRVYKEKYNSINVVVDPFSRISFQSELNTNFIGQVLSKFQNLAVEQDIILHLVCHPTKLKDGQLTGESILGSIHFRNTADYVILVEKGANYTTNITIDKVRDNLRCGLVGTERTLYFNPQNFTFSNIPFGNAVCGDLPECLCKTPPERTNNMVSEYIQSDILKNNMISSKNDIPDHTDNIISEYENIESQISGDSRTLNSDIPSKNDTPDNNNMVVPECINTDIPKNVVSKYVPSQYDIVNRMVEKILTPSFHESNMDISKNNMVIESKNDIPDHTNNMVSESNTDIPFLDTPQSSRISPDILSTTMVDLYKLKNVFSKKAQKRIWITGYIKRISLNEAIELGAKECKKEIDTLRQMNSEDKDAKIDYKRHNLLMYTVSGLFGQSREIKNIEYYNNGIAIDVDVDEVKNINTHLSLNEIKQRVNSLGFVFYSAESASGKGLFALVALDGDKNDFKSHFKALEADFEAIGITIDEKCSDVSRTRFVSYDNNPYFNPDAYVYNKKFVSLHTLPRINLQARGGEENVSIPQIDVSNIEVKGNND